MTQFAFQFFGKFQICVGTKPVSDFHSDKARALLSYLAIEPQEHTRVGLATLLWPDIGDRYARTNLRNTLYRLRQTLEAAAPGAADKLLTVARQSVQFNVTDAAVDVHRFQTLLDNATADARTQLDQLQEAVNLYDGELLAGFELGDAQPFGEWLLLRREMLHQQAMMAFSTLATAYEAAGNLDRAYGIITRLLSLEPCHEASYRHAMRLLALMGQPEQALQYLEQMRHVLRAELDVEPSEETLALAQQIAAGHYDRFSSPPHLTDTDEGTGASALHSPTHCHLNPREVRLIWPKSPNPATSLDG